MSTYNERVFSEFGVTNVGIKFSDDTEATVFGCTGSLKQAMNVKTVTKKCEGVVTKTKTKGDGTGTLTLSIHAKYDLLTKALGMNRDELVTGVKAYGKNSVHEAFTLTAKVTDEDDVEKLVAYPNCMITNKPEITITNGDEEVAEVELEISVMPDDYDEGVYEAICESGYLEDETVISSWLTNFSRSLVVLESEDEA